VVNVLDIVGISAAADALRLLTCRRLWTSARYSRRPLGAPARTSEEPTCSGSPQGGADADADAAMEAPRSPVITELTPLRSREQGGERTHPSQPYIAVFSAFAGVILAAACPIGSRFTHGWDNVLFIFVVLGICAVLSVVHVIALVFQFLSQMEWQRSSGSQVGFERWSAISLPVSFLVLALVQFLRILPRASPGRGTSWDAISLGWVLLVSYLDYSTPLTYFVAGLGFAVLGVKSFGSQDASPL